MASGIVSDLSWCQKLHNRNVQSSQQSSDRSCFCTNTRTTHARQNKPYRLGVVPAGVVGARGRCCPAATVPVAVVFACGVCCCIAEEIQNEIIDRKRELCHHRPQSKAHSNEYENTHKSFKLGFWVCGSEGVRDVHVLNCTAVAQIGVAIYSGVFSCHFFAQVPANCLFVSF